MGTTTETVAKTEEKTDQDRPSFAIARKSGAWLQDTIGGNLRMAGHLLHEQYPELDESKIMAYLMCAYEQVDKAKDLAYAGFIKAWNLSWTPKDEAIPHEALTDIHVSINGAWHLLW